MSPACPVCLGLATAALLTVDGRDYWRCETCSARFLDPAQRPDRDDERRHYLTHENAADDPGYRRFLSRLAEPLIARTAPGARGLDYGCGPVPVLAAMLAEAGRPSTWYDPAFHDDEAVLDGVYDFVACSETAEHFHRPAAEFDRLGRMLRPGGWLAVMTCFQTDDTRFAAWHYRRDPTHVVFYRAETLHHVARARGWSCEIPRKDVAMMRKGPDD